MKSYITENKEVLAALQIQKMIIEQFYIFVIIVNIVLTALTVVIGASWLSLLTMLVSAVSVLFFYIQLKRSKK